MNKLLSLYNKNRHTIWVAIAILIMVNFIVRTMNNYAKEQKRISSSTNTTTYSEIINNPNYSVIEGKVANSKEVDYISNIIKNFIENCNSGEVEKAYSMLSEDCKNNMFKTEDEFIKKYLNVYFRTKKTYEYKAWLTDSDITVYRIELEEDLLSTGGTNVKKVEDFFTVVNENGIKKLNINKYITHVEINKQLLQNNVRITVLSKDVFLENVIYNFKIENFLNYDIEIGNTEKQNSVVLTDSNNFTHIAALWEQVNTNLTVYKKNVKNLSIKFLREYNPKYEEKTIEFNNIVINSENESDKIKIEIDL